VRGFGELLGDGGGVDVDASAEGRGRGGAVTGKVEREARAGREFGADRIPEPRVGAKWVQKEERFTHGSRS
jgi:hypothetical protein